MYKLTAILSIVLALFPITFALYNPSIYGFSYVGTGGGVGNNPNSVYGANYPYDMTQNQGPMYNRNNGVSSSSSVPSQNLMPPHPVAAVASTIGGMSQMSSSSLSPPMSQTITPISMSQSMSPMIPVQVPFPMPLPASPAFPNPAEFNQAINQYVSVLQNHLAAGGTFAYSSPGATAYAYSSLSPNILNQQNEIWNLWKNNGGANSMPYYPPSYAAATASYNPSGFHQTAAIYPPNANSPNIDTRFEGSDTLRNGGNGFYGIATAAFSSSSNINGVESNRKAAYSAVNDNGKISTYKVES